MAFVGFLKQSTAVDLPVGPFLDSTDGNTVESGLTITQPDVRLKKNGAAWAQKNAAQTLSHEENGHYEVALDATDTNTLGFLRLVIHESGGLQIVQDYMVVVASVYDLFFTYGLSMLGVVAYGTAQAGAAGSIQLAAATAFGDDIVNGATAIITGGTGVGQSRAITDYVSSTDTASVDPNFGTAPDSSSTYSVLASPPAPTTTPTPVNVTHNAGTAITAASGIQEVKVASMAAGSVTAAAIATGAVDADALATDAVTEIVSAVLTTQMTEAYAADGAAPTLAQALMLIQQQLGEFSISGTTLTVKKVDGSTTAATFTLNDATSPTSITRST